MGLRGWEPMGAPLAVAPAPGAKRMHSLTIRLHLPTTPTPVPPTGLAPTGPTAHPTAHRLPPSLPPRLRLDAQIHVRCVPAIRP